MENKKHSKHLLIIYYVRGPELGILKHLNQFELWTRYYYYPHFTDDEPEVWNVKWPAKDFMMKSEDSNWSLLKQMKLHMSQVIFCSTICKAKDGKSPKDPSWGDWLDKL